MSGLVAATGMAALLGSAVVGGVFFAFSSFVMKALARVPSEEGIAAMQSINVTVINPGFLVAFVGTAILSLAMAGFALTSWDRPWALYFLAGAIFYVAGTFLVTGLGNVPLNDQLAAVTNANATGIDVWEHYLKRWTVLNHLRTAAAIGAALMFTKGLLLQSAAL